MAEREFKIKIVGDASGLAAESTRAAEGLKSVGASGEEAGRKLSGGTEKGIGGMKGLANVIRADIAHELAVTDLALRQCARVLALLQFGRSLPARLRAIASAFRPRL